MKKIVTFIFSAFLAVSAFAVDFEVRLVPQLNIPFQNVYKLGYGGILSADIIPLTIRTRDSLTISLRGNIDTLPANVNPGTEFGNMNFFGGGIAVGYECRFHDRFSVHPEVNFGVLGIPQIPEEVVNYVNTREEEKKYTSEDLSLSGFYVGGGIGFNYFLRPELAVIAQVNYLNFISKPKSLLSEVSVGLGVKYSITKGLFTKPEIETSEVETAPLFPVFYSRYDSNKFGTITFVSNEKNTINDVEVQVYIEQYMANPKVVAQYETVVPGEEMTVDLTAFLNENIMNSILSRKADAKITVNYKSLGKKLSYTEIVELQALSRNSMSWEDDRRAAAFVSGRDASALKFARQVVSIVKNNLDPKLPVNYQYAAALFGALKAYGISYVIDPASAFTDNVGSASIDFLQFPYQTLLYHGGDCDDLTILNCSLLEALGIDTAFITVPGHIYMAFNSGVALADADSIFGKNKYIVKGDKVWIPIEVTVSQDSFALARSIGLREWKKYESEAQLIEMDDAWLEYKPVSVPESDIDFQMPSKDKVLKGFKDAIR